MGVKQLFGGEHGKAIHCSRERRRRFTRKDENLGAIFYVRGIHSGFLHYAEFRIALSNF